MAVSTTAFDTHNAIITATLTGGVDANEPSTGEISTGLDVLADAETLDVNLLFAYPDDTDSTYVVANKLISICESRKDCMAFISPPTSESIGKTNVNDVKAWVDNINSTSYASVDSSAVYVYDKYNDTYRWIGANGLCAGLCANTDQVADAWFSPAGYNRGGIKNLVKLAFNPKKAERDGLYQSDINPVVTFPGQGTILFGDKTLLGKPSAFDRINVRRLFIVLEKAISTASKFSLFEFNDAFTRSQFKNLVEPFLRDIQGRRGIVDFRVVCDETNNTGEVIDRNEFIGDIYVKPSRSINFIQLNFVAVRSGVEFSEVVGQF